MYRKTLLKLAEWKSSSRRKPLVLKGARQVGKTWILKEFGKQNYENVAYFNFDENEEYKQKLQDYYDVKLNKGKKQDYYNPHKKKF